MKKPRALARPHSLLAIEGVPLAKAGDEPGSEKQAAGKSLGGMNGMMIGAIGGPIGMLVGAGIGALFGRGAQEAAGLSDRAYKVRTADGKEKVVRSNEAFEVGDKVATRGNRAFSDVAKADDSLYDSALSYRE